MLGHADEFVAIPSDGFIGPVCPVEVFLPGKRGYERRELFSIELQEGREFASAPLEEGKGGDASGFVKLAQFVGSELFGTDGGAVAEGNLEFGGNGVPRRGGFEIWRKDDAEPHGSVDSGDEDRRVSDEWPFRQRPLPFDGYVDDEFLVEILEVEEVADRVSDGLFGDGGKLFGEVAAF